MESFTKGSRDNIVDSSSNWSKTAAGKLPDWGTDAALRALVVAAPGTHTDTHVYTHTHTYSTFLTHAHTERIYRVQKLHLYVIKM